MEYPFSVRHFARASLSMSLFLLRKRTASMSMSGMKIAEPIRIFLCIVSPFGLGGEVV